MSDDACSVVKSDLKAGSYTNYTNSFSKYIVGKDTFQGGDVHIILDNAWREPVQTVSGSILFTKKGCSLEIVAPTAEIRDSLYLDIVDVLTATCRGYIIKQIKDKPVHKNQQRMMLKVEMSL